MTENDIVVGNAYDKYGSKNPIVRWMMNGFEQSLSRLITRARPQDIHEVGCGEGYWVMKWMQQGLPTRGSDFSSRVIGLAARNAREQGLPSEIFEQRSIYELEADRDAADLVVCCEVLEHLERPEEGLRALQGIVRNHIILSVPREPLWRMLNVARGKYLPELGNTPGHLQHWSKSSFVQLLEGYFDVLQLESPLPWTMVLCRAAGPGKKENG
jgi:2-polyprenyl-3-methyl-5-hydroxy-6-metoxy-1,4-benzoquinol methylase